MPEMPEPYPHGRCEFRNWIASQVGYAYCGKRGRWLVRGQIRCGEHKNA